MHAPSEAVLETLPERFNPYSTTSDFVPFLARWVDLDWLLARELTETEASLASGSGRLRDLIASATYLSRWRGTERGLLRFLEIATGMSEFRDRGTRRQGW